MKIFPLKKKLLGITDNSDSFKNINISKEVEIPVGCHVGAFSTQRKNHKHEGIDLYADEGSEVISMENGKIVMIEHFTGTKANSPWWGDTMAVHIEGESGVIVYGEITPVNSLKIGFDISAGQTIGHVAKVLLKDKGRPQSMLHIELYKSGSRESVEWHPWVNEKPDMLLNPTELLVNAIPYERSFDYLTYLLSSNRFQEATDLFKDTFEPLKGFEHNHPCHYLDVYDHTIKALELSKNDLLVRVVLLLHDIGKLETRVVGDGCCHFYGHELKSAEKAIDLLANFQDLDENLIGNILNLIKIHDIKFNLEEDYLKQYIDTLGAKMFETLMDIKKADLLAHSEFQINRVMPKLRVVEDVFNKYKKGEL